MKYMVLYEDFFSIFPSNRYDNDLEVNNAIKKICGNFIEISPYLNMVDGPHGGLTVYTRFHHFTYVVKNFDVSNQIITLEIYDGEEAKLLLATLTLSTKELKKSLLTDLKNRFDIK